MVDIEALRDHGWSEAEKAADEIERLRAERAWQPIETAPPDQLVLTIWNGINTTNGNPVRYWNVAMLVDGQWCEPEFGDHIDEPTHWMPLPAPPEGQ